MTTITETYLWSALFSLAGFVMVFYFWLQPIIMAKLKFFLTGGQGTLGISPDGSISLKVQRTDRMDCVDIKGRKKPINPNYKQFKFLGIPCHMFVPSIPSNINLLMNKKKLTKEEQKEVDDFNNKFSTNIDVFEGRFDYQGIPDRDIDTHIANMTKDPLREIWLKYKNWLIYIALGIMIALFIMGFLLYKQGSILETCGSVGTTITNVVGAN